MTPCCIAVIIPVFNAARTVAEAIRSVQANRVSDLRILAVDDGSNDHSAEIVASLAADDPRLALIRQPNGGIVAALNAALGRADAEFVARLDADDLSAPDRLSRQMEFLRSNPDVVAVSGAHVEIDAEGRPTGTVFRAPAPENLDTFAIPAREPQLTQPFMMARGAVLKRIGGYRAFPVSEDSDLYWRLLEHGRLAVLDEIVGSYRVHAASVSSASVRNGRLMAVCSQLAALSAQRRQARRPDLDLSPARLDALRGGASMAALLRTAGAGNADAEARWLRAASAAKLMELSGYRPYELEPEDARFIAGALSDLPRISGENLRELRKMRAATAARLLRLGRLGDAMALATPTLWPEIAARAGTGRLYWRKHAVRRPA